MLLNQLSHQMNWTMFMHIHACLQACAGVCMPVCVTCRLSGSSYAHGEKCAWKFVQKAHGKCLQRVNLPSFTDAQLFTLSSVQLSARDCICKHVELCISLFLRIFVLRGIMQREQPSRWYKSRFKPISFVFSEVKVVELHMFNRKMNGFPDLWHDTSRF